jgi:2-methylcitrate dehydratase PrpD
MCKSLHVGRAAQGGLAAALLAQGRFTSSETALEGARGFIHVLSTTPNPAALTARLGEDYELLRNTYKPYACGLVIHPSLDGCIQLRERHALRGPEIERIDLVVHPLALELTGKRSPRTGLEGKFSVFHAAAVAIIDGAGGEAQFGDERVRAPDVVALREKVRARIDPALGKEQGVVSILRKDGGHHELRVEHCAGSLERPLTDAGLDAKFLALSGPLLGAAAERALAALRSLPDARDAGDVARRCAKS